MGIYRGPGGTGDATNDAASEATLVSQLVTQAQESEANASASATAAQTAENNAETAETNAETAASNAATSATNAASSASSASSSASSASTSASTATTKASEAATSATNAANSASSASTSASTATTQATNASNSASAAATSATNASNSASAAATSATNAASSATSAAGSATTATTQASNASTSATNAASSATSAAGSATTATTQAGIATTKAGEAATSATNAANSATAASTSATNAANSATTASTQATNASNSATSAASSATAAAASYDSFDDRYLGAKATAPTVDNDGNTLLVGALYFNTSSNFMKVWDGSTWVDAYASLSGALLSANNLSDLASASTARTNLGVTATGSDTTYAYRANNLSDLASASTARTNLGLGSIATQAANSVAITGGAIDGTTVGATTASSGRFTSLSDSGNLTFTGTGNYILGDFSSTTSVGFQTSTANSTTRLKVYPSGTGTVSAAYLYNNSDPTNSGFGALIYSTSAFNINSGINGTGTYYPIVMTTGGSERLRIDTSGNVGIGTSSPSYKLHVNGRISYSGAIGEGADTTLSSSGTVVQHATSSTWTQQAFFTGGTERIRIDASGNVGIGTAVPTDRFTVVGTGETGAPADGGSKTASIRVSATGGSGNDGGQIEFGAGFGSYGQSYFSAIKGLLSNGAGNTLGHLAFYTRNATTDTSLTERMRIDANGNVGIGTSSAPYRLTVEGGGPQIRVRNSTNRYRSDYSVASDGLTSINSFDDTGGVYKPFGLEASYVYFAPNGTERMRIDSSGNVGIGTSSPSTMLELSGSAAAGKDTTITLNNTTASTGRKYQIISGDGGPFRIQDATAGSERLRIDTSGNVGIGTSSPAYRLDVAAASANNGVIALRAGVNLASFVSIAGNNTTPLTSSFDLIQDQTLAYVWQRANQPLTFGTNNTERMRIDASGNVGIGTSSPAVPLHVFTTSANIARFTRDLATDAVFTIGADNSGTILESSGVNTMRFFTSATERMRIDSSGSVLISRTTSSNSIFKLYVGDGSADTRAVFNPSTQFAVGLRNGANDGGWIGSNGTDTIVFSNSAGTERMRIDSSGNLLFNSGYGSVATAYGCRAWVNFNGTGTVAIRASGNVSSITDNGTGDYTVNFTTAMPDANYCAIANGDRSGNATTDMNNSQLLHTYATGSVRLKTGYPQGLNTLDDSLVNTVAVFR